MFKFSCADFTFPVVDRLPALKLINLLGFSFVDIGLFARSSHFSPLELAASPADYTRRVQDDLNAASLQASDVFLQIGEDPSERATNDPDPLVRARNRDIFRFSLQFCAELHCSHLTGLPGTFHPGCSEDQDLDLAVEEAQWRLEECRKANIVYSIEPHVGSICASVAATHKFLERVQGLTLTLDYGHFIMAGEESSTAHSLIPYASHLHVRGGASGRLQTTVAENTIDFTAMLQRLGKSSYDKFLALEYVWIDWNGCNRTDNVSETLLLRRALENMLAAEGARA